MKRTTLILEDGCLEGVQELARKESRTMSETVNELLLEGLERRKKRVVADFQIPSFHMGKPTANLGDRDELETLMDS